MLLLCVLCVRVCLCVGVRVVRVVCWCVLMCVLCVLRACCVLVCGGYACCVYGVFVFVSVCVLCMYCALVFFFFTVVCVVCVVC